MSELLCVLSSNTECAGGSSVATSNSRLPEPPVQVSVHVGCYNAGGAILEKLPPPQPPAPWRRGCVLQNCRIPRLTAAAPSRPMSALASNDSATNSAQPSDATLRCSPQMQPSDATLRCSPQMQHQPSAAVSSNSSASAPVPVPQCQCPSAQCPVPVACIISRIMP